MNDAADGVAIGDQLDMFRQFLGRQFRHMARGLVIFASLAGRPEYRSWPL